MKFSSKVFITVATVSLTVSGAICFMGYHLFSSRLQDEFTAHYNAQLRLLGDTFIQLEGATELIARNAILILDERNQKFGIASNEQLTQMARSLGVAHFFITNSRGQFIRSTNGPVTLMKRTLFEHCEGYKNLIYGNAHMMQTPIIPSVQEAVSGPFKYVMMPNHNRTLVLEASIPLSFISEMLQETLKEDSAFLRIGFFTPTGENLGSFSAKERPGEENILLLSRQVQLANGDCCECRMKKISVGGQYFYEIRAEVSTKRLNEAMKELRIEMIILTLLALFLSIALAKYLSIRLSCRIAAMKEKVEQAVNTFNLASLGEEKTDEIGEIGVFFNSIISRLSEFERNRAWAQLASQVAHDIKSPITALEAAVLSLTEVPEEVQFLLNTALTRILDISNDLLRKSSENASTQSALKNKYVNGSLEEMSVVPLSTLVDSIVLEKRWEYRSRTNLKFETISNGIYSDGVFVKVPVEEFKRVLSNIINNSVEAMGDSNVLGRICISIRMESEKVILSIMDNGKGMPKEIIPQLMKLGMSYDKKYGNGMGLFHAKECVTRWGGEIEITSDLGKGTVVSIKLQSYSTQ